MELAVLGPLEVVGGTGIEVQGAMVRRLAAALAVCPRGASVDVLVEALWGDVPRRHFEPGSEGAEVAAVTPGAGAA